MYNFGNKNIVTSGLILNIDPMNPKCYNGVGITVSDISNTNIGATLSGVTYGSNRSFIFNGSSHIQGNNILEPSGSFSICAYYNATGTPSQTDGSVLICASPQLNHGFILLHDWSTQYIIFSNVVNQGFVSANNTALNYQTNHVVGTWDGVNQTIYVNGAQVATRSWSTATLYANSGDRNFRIGRWGFPSFDRYFNGEIYNIMMYNKALTQAEVTQNYNSIKNRYGT